MERFLQTEWGSKADRGEVEAMRIMAIMAVALTLAGCAAFAAPGTETSVGRHQPKAAACTSIGTAMYC
jgi:hypothetical protein